MLHRPLVATISALLAIALVGCSSEDFSTAPGQDDSSADETSVVDVGGDARDAGPTTDSAPHADANDATTTDSSTVEATSDSMADGDATDATSGDASETCGTTNACGGCAVLSGAPGDACGSCGKLTCATDGNSLTCTGDHPKNDCGGCTTLTGKIGDACCGSGTLACSADKTSLVCSGGGNACGGCGTLANPPGSPCGGVCGSAKYQCSGKESTTCVDPVPSSPTIGSSCGACGAWACNAGGSALTCGGDHPLNACGGCASLAGAPSTSCPGGKCSSATWVCSGVDAVSCVDPVTTPAPGASCGTCGTLHYACAADGKSTFCPTPDDTNACGGCSVLAPPPGETSTTPGASCGKCRSGSIACNGKNALQCNDPVPAADPAPGTVCGICSKSSYACAADNLSTACTTPDDRSVGVDTDYEPSATAGVSPYFGRNMDFAIAYTTAHKGAITSIKVFVRRVGYFCQSTATKPHPDPACDTCTFNSTTHKYDCTVSSPTDAALTISMYTGSPSTGATAVATASFPTVGSFSTSDTWVTIPFSSAPILAAGTNVWFNFDTKSSAYSLVFEGGQVATSPPPNSESGDYDYIYPVGSDPTGWNGPTTYAPSFVASMDGCF